MIVGTTATGREPSRGMSRKKGRVGEIQKREASPVK